MKKSESGFTLVELIVAIALGTGILAMAGNGLVVIMAKDRQAAADRQNRYELQRTLDFLGQEIRMATSISPCPASAAIDKFQTATGSTNARPILLLRIKDLPAPIVYYLATPPPKNQTVWDGPLVLYRWGPTLLLNGEYSRDVATNTYSYYNELVVDRVTTHSSNSACPVGYDQSIPASGAAGFSLCLGAEGRSVRIALSRLGHQQKAIATWATFSTRSKGAVVANVCGAP
jgi:prepilin-type N-terminal cleavage/methylation domain-containing protein